MTAPGQSEARVGLTEALDALARVNLAVESLDSVLNTVAGLAKRVVPGVEECSVTVVTDEKAESAAWTGSLALELDESQYDRGYGPCLDASVGGGPIRVDDMTRETRWPDYMAVAVEKGARCSLSVPLPIQEQSVGALNLYATTPYAFDDITAELAATFADYAAVALANARAYAGAAAQAEHMRHAMQSRAVIEQAKGIIMGDRRCTADEAFGILVDISQRSNRKLRDVAVALVERARTPRR